MYKCIAWVNGEPKEYIEATNPNPNTHKSEMKKFVSTMGKGFYMSFANGLTVSVQWGNENYCDNRDAENEVSSCNNAEVAVMDIKGNFLNIDYFLPENRKTNDLYAGYLSPEDVLYVMNKAKEFGC